MLLRLTKEEEIETITKISIDANYCDLYDGGANHDKIPFNEIETFIRKNI